MKKPLIWLLCGILLINGTSLLTSCASGADSQPSNGSQTSGEKIAVSGTNDTFVFGVVTEIAGNNMSIRECRKSPSCCDKKLKFKEVI